MKGEGLGGDVGLIYQQNKISLLVKATFKEEKFVPSIDHQLRIGTLERNVTKLTWQGVANFVVITLYGSHVLILFPPWPKCTAC